MALRDQQDDIWIWDFARETLTRLTTDPSNDFAPIWTRDGRRIVFSSTRVSPRPLYDISPDGTRFLLIQAPNTGTQADTAGLTVVLNWAEELKRLVPTR